MDWLTKIWMAQEKINENIGRTIYPYIIPDAYCGWIPWPERTNAFLNQHSYFADKLSLRSTPGRSTPGEKDGNRPRVLFVGDSNVHGDESRFEDCWVTQLDHLVGDQFDVINGGVPGYGIDQAMWRCESLFDCLVPDVVVLSFAACDLTRQVNMLRLLRSAETEVPFIKPIYILENSELRKLRIPEATISNFAEIFSTAETRDLLARHDQFFPRGNGKQFWRAGFKRSTQSVIRYVVPANSHVELLEQAISFLVTKRPLEITLKVMEKFVSWCLSKRITPVIMLFPMQANFSRFSNDNLIYKFVLDFLSERGRAVIDPRPPLIREKFEDTKFWHVGGHLNSEGSQVFSVVMAEALSQILQGNQTVGS